jgi:UDP-N-acetylglucosamine/UDP-N-acetylgalactosamine diphosphorylase
MELHTASHEKIRALMAKGVRIPNPATLDIGDEVQTDHISGDNVTIYPGCRIYGKKTVISSGCRLGYEAPVTIDNCLLGPSVELKGGFFTGSVFLEKASMGSGAQIREGCLLEEEASGAHCVGLKQTILFPFVTLGSLINFCDCLMAGGTSRRDHSEVGSSYIHFNFTPDGDKATPSLFGDVPKGVMLNQRPIFLGGQGGAVGPLQVGYGNVTAAGSILRKSYPGENQLIFEAGPSRSVRIDRGLPYLEINHLVEQNVIYLANLKALAAWYKSVRKSFFEHQESGRLIYEGAIELISGACRERLSRLERMARNALAAAPESAKAEREELVARLPELEEQLYRDEDGGETQLARQEFFALWEQARPGENLPYTEAIRKLPPEVAAAATVWLSSIVDDYCNKARAAFPLLQIFKKRTATGEQNG